MRDTIDTTMFSVDQLESSGSTWYGLMDEEGPVEWKARLGLRDEMCPKCGGDHECRTDHRKGPCEPCGYKR